MCSVAPGHYKNGYHSFLLYPRKATIFLLGSTKQTRNGTLYYDMEAIWKRAQYNWKCHIEKIPPPEFFRLTFPSMKQDWLHGFKDRLIAQKGPPRRTLLIPKMGSKMSKLPIWVTFANIYVSQRQKRDSKSWQFNMEAYGLVGKCAPCWYKTLDPPRGTLLAGIAVFASDMNADM